MARRRRLPVELTDEAHAGMAALAHRHHVTKTAMLEALGLVGLTDSPVAWDDVIAHALRIDRERLSRR